MKKLLINLLAAALAALGAGCAAPSAGGAAAPQLHARLQSDNPELLQYARRALFAAHTRIGAEPDLPLLRLSESTQRDVESLAADGSVGGYRLSYQLRYQFGDQPERVVHRREVIDHNVHLYRAGQAQEREMIATLRQSALAQMLLELEPR